MSRQNQSKSISSESSKFGNSDRKSALDRALIEIEKSFGKGSIFKLNSSEVVPVDIISTGSYALDAALGVGGLPKGRVCEIYGPESSGKTTLCLQVVAEAQKSGDFAAYIDVENALDIGYAQKLGVSMDKLLLSQPDTGEDALSILETLVSSGAVPVIIVDSVAALVPKAELDGDMGSSSVAVQARLMSQALRKLTKLIHSKNVLVIFVNQIRMKIGVMFGSPETTTGGNALKFYSSVRLDIRRTGSIKNKSDDVIGNETTIKVVKNKVAPPFKTAKTQILYGSGFNKYLEVLELAIEAGLIIKSGAWYSKRDGSKIAQGELNSCEYLRSNPDYFYELVADLNLGINKSKIVDVSEDCSFREVTFGNDIAPFSLNPSKTSNSLDADDSDDLDLFESILSSSSEVSGSALVSAKINSSQDASLESATAPVSETSLVSDTAIEKSDASFNSELEPVADLDALILASFEAESSLAENSSTSDLPSADNKTNSELTPASTISLDSLNLSDDILGG